MQTYTKYSFLDLQKLEAEEFQLKERIKNGRFVFDDSTTGFEFVNLGRNENLKEIEFKCPQARLVYLDLGRCALKKIVFPKGLTSLRTIYLNGNQLEEIRFEGDCKSLELLDLSRNKLRVLDLPFPFKNLRFLYLGQNQLTNLSSIESFFRRENFDFSLEENEKLEVPPPEIVERGKLAVRHYFEELQEGEDYIYEAKLLILGEPGAGKTTLARKIQDSDAPMPKKEESTQGIDVHEWHFNYKSQDIRLNIWDFAGQEIYSHTHRFFLSNRSMYAIVADMRKDNTSFNYWLHAVQIFGEDSPAIIVINEVDDRKKEFQYNKLRLRFANLKERYYVNLSRQDDAFKKLINGIEHQISQLPHIGTKVPVNWVKVRDKIADLEKNGVKTISLKEYRTICKEFNIEDIKRQDTLSAYFHSLGVFLHFEKSDILRKIIFLDKDWILNAAYLVIDNKEIEAQKGRFSREDIEKWLGIEYHDYLGEVVDLMKRFYLIYEKDNFFIAPEKLPAELPNYKWSADKSLYFEFVYEDFMPKGILWQFIVEKNQLIYQNKVWKYGVVLSKDDSTYAEITEDEDLKHISIKVSGKYKEDFRAEIVAEIEEINNKQYKNLQVLKKVPCKCEVCVDSENPETFDYSVLIGAKNAGQENWPCPKSFKPSNIADMLSGLKLDSEKIDPRNVNSNSEEAQKKSKVRVILKFVLFFVFLIALLALFYFYPEKWNLLAPFGFVLIGGVAFYDKLLSALGRIKK